MLDQGGNSMTGGETFQLILLFCQCRLYHWHLELPQAKVVILFLASLSRFWCLCYKTFFTARISFHFIVWVHRHLRIYRLLNGTYCLPCLLHQYCKWQLQQKRKEKQKLTLGRPAPVAGTQQTLSNLFWRLSISMYGCHSVS